MKLKNLLASAIAACAMSMPMVTSVMAAEPVNSDHAAPTTQSTNLKYVVGSHYKWSIHTDIDFGHDKGIKKTDVDGAVTDGSDQKVKVLENVIEEGKKLHITAAGSGTDGAFSVKNGASGTEVLTYAVKSGENAVAANGAVLDVVAGENAGETPMTFTLSTTKNSAEKAGTYTGTITYSASVIDQVAAHA